MMKIMIIEDDPMVRMILEAFIGKVGNFNIVSQVSDIDEAQDFLEDNEVDLILLDVFLPLGSGIDLLKWIREKDIAVDAILITAENTKTSIKEAFRFGAIDYIVKPFVFERFKESLDNFIFRHKGLVGQDDINQEVIDKYIKGIKAEENTNMLCDASNLAKGLNINTYNTVYNFMTGQNDEVTADFVANEVGLARVTVRRYLDYMVKEDKISLIQSYGKIGRPTHFYKRK
ncbi:response regulator [Clostridium sp. Sa3CUN1]|uniref:Transcriptional regulatory protein n=1 Tax=Clostridium gallinarum TaxID=2762246 RepID=A0ABR8Q0K6_9CLOT|nr:response regulator [Clostridium gallinarum]MBD7913956.1 response regulator [Clostridium gallinarum]